MGAPTAAKRRATRAKKETALERVDSAIEAGEEVTEADIDALEAEVDQAVAADDGPIGPDGEIRPVEIGRAGHAGPEMVHIFTLDGTQYSIPKNPSPAIMLRFLREVRDKRVGRDAAVENAMMALLGKKALDALAESPETSDEDVANVFIIVGHILFGAVRRWRKRTNPS